MAKLENIVAAALMIIPLTVIFVGISEADRKFVLIILIILAVCALIAYLKNKFAKKEDEVFDGYKVALNFLEHGYNIFVTGGAGTGKSYILNKLKKHYGGLLNITSTTGISALNVNGQTIHSWSGIGIANKPIQEVINKIRDKSELYKQIAYAKMLAIDEISMLDNKTLNYINEVLKRVRNNDKPFGGIQVLLFGDFLQLPPVELGKNDVDFCFNSETWRELNLQPIILKDTKRQTEPEYIDALNNIRIGTITPENSKLFFDKEEISREQETDGVLHIFGTNEEADNYNKECFDKIENPIFKYTSDDIFYRYDKYGKATEIAINYSNLHNLREYEQNRVNRFNNDCKAPNELILKVGTRVMLIRNIDQNSGLVNGSCGTVSELGTDLIKVKFDNNKTFEVKKVEFIAYSDAQPKIKREQYPLRLAYGITIHKSQGMTFDNLVVDLDNVFSCGQAYVALSRTKTLEGLIIRNYLPGKVTVNPEVVQFYDCIEKGKPYIKKNIPQTNDQSKKDDTHKDKFDSNKLVDVQEQEMHTTKTNEPLQEDDIEEQTMEHKHYEDGNTIIINPVQNKEEEKEQVTQNACK